MAKICPHGPVLAMLLALSACHVLLLGTAKADETFPDIRSIKPDLRLPPVSHGEPTPGKRVVRIAPEYEGTEVHHTLYLPEDWRPGQRFPVIVEYAGNGLYENKYGDISTGEVEGSKMGYGLSGGKGFIWLCTPYLNTKENKNQTRWWGDVEATVEYCKRTVRRVCERYGGDPSALILTGFSRGAIACNFIGLHDDEIADIWLAFMPYSHYDGVRRWDYPDSGREAARERLRRLQGRASFITHERSVEETRRYLSSTGIEAPFTLRAIRFRNHNDGWTLRDIPARRAARTWLRKTLEERPGTYSVRGRVTDPAGRPLSGVRVESGPFHWTSTREDGRYVLPGLIKSRRTVRAVFPGVSAASAERSVVIAGQDLPGIDLVVGSGDEP